MHSKSFILVFVLFQCFYQTFGDEVTTTTGSPAGPTTTPGAAAGNGSASTPPTNGTSGNETETESKAALQPRIIGGRPAYPEEFPHQLQLLHKGQHFCGATLVISPNTGHQIGITAAHCIFEQKLEDFVVRAGSVIIDGDDAQELRLKKMIAHEQFNLEGVSHDIGLLIFDGQFTLDATVKPLSLPKRKDEPVEGIVTVSGFGYVNTHQQMPKHLQMVRLPVVNNKDCGKVYAGVAKIGKTHLCAGDKKQQWATCNGDSGGPALATSRSGKQFLAGAVSFGLATCVEKIGVFARVSQFLDWIKVHSGPMEELSESETQEELRDKAYYMDPMDAFDMF